MSDQPVFDQPLKQSTELGTQAIIQQKAMHLLAVREHSRVELVQKLQRAGYELKVIEQVVEALHQQGLQSDQRFAEAYSQAKLRRGYGVLKIRHELLGKGISPQMIEQVLGDSEAEAFEYALIYARKKSAGEDLQQPKGYRRAYNRLASRGFPADWIKRLLQGL